MTPQQRFQEVNAHAERLDELSSEDQRAYLRALEKKDPALHREVVALRKADDEVVLPQSPVPPQAESPKVKKGVLRGSCRTASFSFLLLREPCRRSS